MENPPEWTVVNGTWSHIVNCLRSPLKANLKKTLQIREIAFFFTRGYMVESGNFYNGRFLSTIPQLQGRNSQNNHSFFPSPLPWISPSMCRKFVREHFKTLQPYRAGFRSPPCKTWWTFQSLREGGPLISLRLQPVTLKNIWWNDMKTTGKHKKWSLKHKS